MRHQKCSQDRFDFIDHVRNGGEWIAWSVTCTDVIDVKMPLEMKGARTNEELPCQICGNRKAVIDGGFQVIVSNILFRVFRIAAVVDRPPDFARHQILEFRWRRIGHVSAGLLVPKDDVGICHSIILRQVFCQSGSSTFVRTATRCGRSRVTNVWKRWLIVLLSMGDR